jgi:aerobic-type carbon monoxide dehydrogenase small subunit (CoxS/CutS family)
MLSLKVNGTSHKLKIDPETPLLSNGRRED